MVNKYRNRRPKTGLSSSGGYNAPLLRPLKNLYPLSQCERVFLDATEHGDKATIQAVLQEPPENFSVNCTDLLGRTALEIAVWLRPRCIDHLKTSLLENAPTGQKKEEYTRWIFAKQEKGLN
uniref:Uncharacterized protein n=1 Tax=Romanomermis culicivorax TaxID=13658 RepID=A0A915IJ05_ROMCU